MSKLETNTIDSISGTNTLQVGDGNVATINLGKSGDTINIPSGATITNSGTANGFGGANTPAFLAKYGATVGSISEASNVKLTGFNTELYDTDNTFSNNSKFTPGVAGRYYIYGAISNYAGSTVQTASAYLYKNGSLFANFENSFESAVLKANSTNTVNWSITDTADSDDYYEIYFNQNNSGNSTYNIYGESGSMSTWFGAYKLIG